MTVTVQQEVIGLDVAVSEAEGVEGIDGEGRFGTIEGHLWL